MAGKKQLRRVKMEGRTTEIRRRPGGRSARVYAAVIEATLAMIDAGDMPVVEEVARRAGVQKTSIYRRWSNLEGLVFDAVAARAGEMIPLPDTGSCTEDLTAYLAASVEYHSSAFGRLVTRMSVQVPESIRLAFWRDRLDAASILIRRGQQRGELRSDVDPRLAIEMLVAPFYFRSLISGGDILPALATGLLEIGLSGLAGPLER